MEDNAVQGHARDSMLLRIDGHQSVKYKEGRHGVMLRSTAFVTQEWSVNGEARQMYESRWAHFVSRIKGKRELGKLTYVDIPWPAAAGAPAHQLTAVMLAGAKVKRCPLMT